MTPIRPDRHTISEAFGALRGRRLRVHAITSPVAAERTANTLLALGIRPTLTVNPEEVGDFVAGADAMLINLGMMDPVRGAAIPRAIAAAKAAHKPWVLDPVFIDVSGPRRALALDCLAHGPSALKVNSAEASLAAQSPAGVVRVVTGAADVVELAGQRVTLANGHPLATRVTAMGCALGAVIAAALAAIDDPFLATATAVALYGVAGDRAAATASGPGSFAPAFLDALHGLEPRHLLQQVNLS